MGDQMKNGMVGVVAQTTIGIHFAEIEGTIDTTWKLGYIYIKGEFLVQKLELDVSEKLKYDMRIKLIFCLYKSLKLRL